MLVVHDAEQVAERVDDRRGHEPGTPLGDGVMLLGPQRQQPLERRVHVVDVPVKNRAAGSARTGRGVAAVNDAKLGLVVADTELHVGRWSVYRAGEVGLDA